MGKRLFFWELGGFLFTASAGALLRGACVWGGRWAAVFSGVNGSVWEHMKLLFVPVFLFSLVQMCLLGREYPYLPAARAASVLFGLALIPVLSYTYTGVLGYRLPWAEAVLFLMADFGIFWLDFRLLRQSRRMALWRQVLGLAALWGLAFCFVWCTFRPPDLGLWRDPEVPGTPRPAAAGAFLEE